MKQRRGEEGGQRVAERRPSCSGEKIYRHLCSTAGIHRRVGTPTRYFHRELGKDSLLRGRTDKNRMIVWALLQRKMEAV